MSRERGRWAAAMTAHCLEMIDALGSHVVDVGAAGIASEVTKSRVCRQGPMDPRERYHPTSRDEYANGSRR